MLLIGIQENNCNELCTKYPDKFNYITYDNTNSSDEYLIKYIENIKASMLQYDVTYTLYSHILITCLNKLNINYNIVINNDKDKFTDIKENITEYDISDSSMEDVLYNKYDWIIKQETLPEVPNNKNKLTFEELLNEDVNITEADVREFKVIQNKLKVGMLLQAKNNLNRILKLSKTLDRLYDELIDRIDNDITNTDTASLMYTADYISKALQDTNNFVVNLLNNDKIQNFFIIDNSQNINIGDDKMSVNSREKIRKAVEIVLENIDLFQQGKFNELRNPNEDNIIEVQGENNDTTSKPISN